MEMFTLKTRKLSLKKYRKKSSFIFWWETSFEAKYNELKKIKNFIIVLLKIVLSDKIITGN